MCIWSEYWRRIWCRRKHGLENFNKTLLSDIPSDRCWAGQKFRRFGEIRKSTAFSKGHLLAPIGSREFQSTPSHPVFRREPKLRKATINLVMTARPPSWNDSALNERISIKFDISLFFDNLLRKAYVRMCYVYDCVYALLYTYIFMCVWTKIYTQYMFLDSVPRTRCHSSRCPASVSTLQDHISFHCPSQYIH